VSRQVILDVLDVAIDLLATGPPSAAPGIIGDAVARLGQERLGFTFDLDLILSLEKKMDPIGYWTVPTSDDGYAQRRLERLIAVRQRLLG